MGANWRDREATARLRVNWLTQKHPRMVTEGCDWPARSSRCISALPERRVELVFTRTVEFADRNHVVVENIFDDASSR